MKQKQTIIAVVVVTLVLVAGALSWRFARPKDKCSSRDREINNCVPAGKCSPNPGLDAVLDCEVKNYDRKYNTEL
jgi:hypothetical protein